MAAKDLQLAGKDLQLAGITRPRIQNGLSEVPNGRSGTDNSVHLLSALRRQWVVLLLATVTSSVVAYMVSAEFKTVTTTAHLLLKARPLPLTSNSGVYRIPDANSVVDIVTSPEVLNDELIAEHELPPLKTLAKQLSTKPNSGTGTVAVSLALPDDKNVVPVLNKIGANLTQAIRALRVQQLELHAGYVQELLIPTTAALDSARKRLIEELLHDQSVSGSNVLKTADLQNLLTRRAQFETNLESANRRVTRIRRNAALLTERATRLLDNAMQQVLQGRRNQIQSHGKGLTSATRSFAVRTELQAQLQELEGALPSSAEAVSRMIDVGALSPFGKADTAPVSEVNTPQAASRETAQALPSAREVFLTWSTQVLGVGQDVIGGFDQVTAEFIEATQANLATFEANAQELNMDAFDLASDMKYYQEMIEVTADSVEDVRGNFDLAAVQAGIPSETLMKVEAEVAQSEEQHAYVRKQLNEINRIKLCPMTEYFVSRAAMFDPLIDVKSNRKKLFAMAFLCSGLLLVAPSVLIELMRLRPTPAGVFSRRWNLPMLGIQAADRSGLHRVQSSGQEMQPELRLMALRIQQSLFQPSGRVVLFSGLDHDESPLVLIRELAKCLSQREETVLIIQSLPCQLEIRTSHPPKPAPARRLKKITPNGSAADKQEAHNGRQGRAGVAEFLAGDSDDASELVLSTGFPGIDFLPGGCVVSASEAMASRRMTALIDQFRNKYSIILLSGPSTLNPADLQMLAARADGIVFTVCKQSLRSVYGEEVLGDLIELGAPILGFAEQASRGKHAVPSAASSETDFSPDFSAVI